MKKFRILYLLPVCFLLVGWGNVGHKIINKNTILSFPKELDNILFWADSLAAHGSDADYRKSWDPEEDIKHYIDIDNYPEFISAGKISSDFDSLTAKYGTSFVLEQGILPWAIIETFFSLQTAFQQGNWQNAMLIAADLGHYVGDCHMPLHLTKNYNGQYSGQYGIHSRYESTMINTYQQQIIYSGDTISQVFNISDFVFEMLYENYQYVDSVLSADKIAKNYSGGNYNNAYYQKLWEVSKGFTNELFKNASLHFATLIYTAWKDAGEPAITEVKADPIASSNFKLEQNYPNPFNPATKLSFSIPSNIKGETEKIVLKIYDLLGKDIATLVNEDKSPGTYEIMWNASNLPSGTYFYQLRAGSFLEIKKMILLK